MADRIVVMGDGLMAQVDTPERLFGQPNSSWVCEFVGGGNLLRGELASADGGARMDIAPGSSVCVAAAAMPGGVVQVPFDKVRLRPCPAGEGLPVTGRRFLGATVELHLAYPAGTVCAHVSPAEAAPFPVGAHAHVGADPADCRLLPDR